MPHCVGHSPLSPGTWQSHGRHLTLLREKCLGLPSVPWSLPRCHPKISTAGSLCQLLHFWLTGCCCTRCFPFHQAWVGDSSGTGLRRAQLSQCAKIGTLICSPPLTSEITYGHLLSLICCQAAPGFQKTAFGDGTCKNPEHLSSWCLHTY